MRAPAIGYRSGGLLLCRRGDRRRLIAPENMPTEDDERDEKKNGAERYDGPLDAAPRLTRGADPRTRGLPRHRRAWRTGRSYRRVRRRYDGARFRPSRRTRGPDRRSNGCQAHSCVGPRWSSGRRADAGARRRPDRTAARPQSDGVVDTRFQARGAVDIGFQALGAVNLITTAPVRPPQRTR